MLISSQWRHFLSEDVAHNIDVIEKRIDLEIAEGAIVFPEKQLRYRALNIMPSDVSVIILGQDPYHGKGEAMGLSFSVPRGKAIPSSLRNMYNELHDDIGFVKPKHGDLQAWADQGVLLLNRYLSVELDKANSHRDIGWQYFTNEIIFRLAAFHQEKLILVLLGAQAAKIEHEIDLGRCHVIKTSHPSSLGGAYKKGFQGSRLFSRINTYLASHGRNVIDWTLID